MKLLIGYGTGQGQTARIASRIATRLREAGNDVVVGDIDTLPAALDLEAFDGILLGASLHARGYQRRVARFIRANLPALQRRPTAFFSVCMAIESRFESDRKEAVEIPRRFVSELGWTPDERIVFAGALAFTKYNFLTRWVMRRIAEKEMGAPVDTTRDHEFTDWAAVDEFAAAFQLRVERRRRAVAQFHPRGEAAAAP